MILATKKDCDDLFKTVMIHLHNNNPIHADVHMLALLFIRAWGRTNNDSRRYNMGCDGIKRGFEISYFKN